MDIDAASLPMLEQQVIVPAHHQGAVRQQRQEVPVGGDAGMAHDHDEIRAGKALAQVGLGPVGRGRYGEPVARRLGIGVQGIGRHADHAQRTRPKRQCRHRRGIAQAAARVGDGRDHLQAQILHPGHDIGQVRRQVVVVVAQIDHRRGDARQLRQKGPVDHAARADGHDIAVLEDVAVYGDHMGDGMGPRLRFEGGQEAGGAIVGRVQVRNGQDPRDRRRARHAHKPRRQGRGAA